MFLISGGLRDERQCVHEGEEASERVGGGLEVPGGGVQPYQGGLAHHMGKTGRCVMLSSCTTKVPVLISIISGEILFNHRWRCTCYTTAGQICVSSQLPGRQELLPLQLVNCFFHCKWSTISSIVGGQLLLPLLLVNLFHCRWSTASSIVLGQVLLPLQLVSSFLHCSWSRLLPLQVVKYFFHYKWSSTSSMKGV